MTTIAPLTTTASRTPLIGTLAFAASALLTAYGTFSDGSEDHRTRAYLVTLGIVVVAAVALFGTVVRTATGRRPGRRSAVLGVLAVLSLPVFWLGLPAILAGGAMACALAERDDTARVGRGGTAGIALGCVAVAGAVVFALIG